VSGRIDRSTAWSTQRAITPRWTAATRERIHGWLLLLPAVVLVVGVLFYPIFDIAWLSLQHYVLTAPADRGFAGFENYKAEFLDDSVLPLATVNTLIWAGLSVAIQFLLGFSLALLLWRSFRFDGVYKSLVLAPWAISGTLAGLMWLWIFNGQIGVLNDFLLRLNLISEPIAWLDDPDSALYALVVPNVWRGIPYFTIMLLAALQGIPEEVCEAASLDCTNRRQELWHIILPMIRPMIVTTVLLRVIWTFTYVDIIYVMTGGGPANSTHTLASWTFVLAFQLLDFGRAAAVAVLMLGFLMIFAIVYLVLVRRTDETGGGMF